VLMVGFMVLVLLLLAVVAVCVCKGIDGDRAKKKWELSVMVSSVLSFVAACRKGLRCETQRQEDGPSRGVRNAKFAMCLDHFKNAQKSNIRPQRAECA